MSVHLFPINVKTAEPIGPKICDATVTCPRPGKVCSEFKKFDFRAILKIYVKILWNPQTFFDIFLFELHEEKMLSERVTIQS